MAGSLVWQTGIRITANYVAPIPTYNYKLKFRYLSIYLSISLFGLLSQANRQSKKYKNTFCMSI
jgi:hypothetical protein